MDMQNFRNEAVKNMNLVNPTPAENAVTIAGVERRSGKIVGYQLSNGRTVDKQQGVQMARDGQIKGVGVAHRKGSEYLRTLPDGRDANNLSNMASSAGMQ